MSKAIFLAGGFAASLMVAQGPAHAAQAQAAVDSPPASAAAQESGAASLMLEPERPKVLIKPFASAAAGADFAETDTACLAGKSAPLAATSKVQSDLALDISKALEKKLAGRMDVLPDAGPESLPNGALIIVGCLTKADGGSAAERLIGFGLGASRLDAHVRFLTKTDRGLEPVDEFDVEAIGSNWLPPTPVGLVVSGVMGARQTLVADAGKLAGEIAACALKSKCPAAKNTKGATGATSPDAGASPASSS